MISLSPLLARLRDGRFEVAGSYRGTGAARRNRCPRRSSRVEGNARAPITRPWKPPRVVLAEIIAGSDGGDASHRVALEQALP